MVFFSGLVGLDDLLEDSESAVSDGDNDDDPNSEDCTALDRLDLPVTLEVSFLTLLPLSLCVKLGRLMAVFLGGSIGSEIGAGFGILA